MIFSDAMNAILKNFLKGSSVPEERGHGVLEMALTLMVLLPLTFGIIDIGRCVYAQSVIRAAAQEGVRAGMVNRENVASAIYSHMGGLNTNHATIQIDKSANNIITVSITYEFIFVTPMIDGFVNGLRLIGTASAITK